MLAAAALILKRTAERIAVVVFALFCVCMVVGIEPIFGLVSGLPGFSAAHNERLLIYFLLCIALLAGWGIDDLSAGACRARRSARGARQRRASIVCIPIVWLLAAGTLSLSETRRRPRGRLGLRASAAAGVRLGDSGEHGGDHQGQLLLIWLPLAGGRSR